MDYWWRELERIINANEATILHENILQTLLHDALKEKDRCETEQIIARLQYKPCFSYNSEAESSSITLRMKFRYLALYYYRVRNYERFGNVVLSSIIREWPVTMRSAEIDDDSTFVWDRAPMSIEMKKGSIRKEGDKYVIRFLALSGADIGSILDRADVSTQLLTIDEYGEQVCKGATIMELRREGDKNKDAPAPQRKRARASTIVKEEALSPAPTSYFEHGFKHLLTGDGSSYEFEGTNDKSREDYISLDSDNIIFTIVNISIIDPNDRRHNQKYVLHTDFEFHFVSNDGTFIVRSADQNCSARSMPFEASSNASIHWKKSFSAIWDTMLDYYYKTGQLEQLEIEKRGLNEDSVLCWVRVKEMVKHFISCHSDIKVRPLLDTELRTVSRMIFARTLAEENEKIEKAKKKNGWFMNHFDEKNRNKIQDHILHKRIANFPADKTFTQVLNSEMQSVTMHDRFKVKQSFFTNKIVLLSGAEVEYSSCNIYEWLHAVAEIVTGQILHPGNPTTTIRMFNKRLITLRSAESAKVAVQKILDHNAKAKAEGSRAGDECITSLMIRIDEREDHRLLFEMIDPSWEVPHLFGSFHTNAIKETKLAFNNSSMSPKQIQDARTDGLVSKTKNELCGLVAALKTGYLGRFHKIMVQESKRVLIYPIFNSEGAVDPMYRYDFEPSKMVDNEINPLIGPISKKGAGGNDVDVISLPETMASLRITHNMQQMRQMQQQTQSRRPTQAPQQVYVSASPQQPPSPFFAQPYPPQPNTQNLHQSNVSHNQQGTQPLAQNLQQPMQPMQQVQTTQTITYLMQPLPSIQNMLPVQSNQTVQQSQQVHYGSPPPYSSMNYGEVTYATQGVQAAYPFTPPPDPASRQDGQQDMTNYAPL